jgi:hypothetical protein
MGAEASRFVGDLIEAIRAPFYSKLDFVFISMKRVGLKHWIMKTDVSGVSRESGTKISQRRYWMESWLIEVVANNIQTMSDREKYVDSRTLAAREEEIRVSNTNLQRRDFDDATGCSDSEEFSNSVDEECDDEYDDDEYEDAEEPRRREITKVQV